MKYLVLGSVFINLAFTVELWYFNRFTQWGIFHAFKNTLPLWILSLYPLYSQLKPEVFAEKTWFALAFISTFILMPLIQMIHYPWTYYHFMLYVFHFVYALKGYNRLHQPNKAWLLTVLSVIAYSETWEIPIHLHGWLSDSWSLIFQVSSGVPRLMALPILLYLNGKPRLDGFRLLLLILTIIPTFYFAPYIHYGMMIETHYRLFCALPYVAYPFLIGNSQSISSRISKIFKINNENNND